MLFQLMCQLEILPDPLKYGLMDESESDFYSLLVIW